MPSTPLISIGEWKKQYPIEAYQNVQKKAEESRNTTKKEGAKLTTVKLTPQENIIANRVAFYFIVNVQDDAKCEASIRTIARQKLCYSDTEFHQFTPLHAAVLLDKVKVVQFLCSIVNLLGAKDEKGFTPYALSALVNGEVYKTFAASVNLEDHFTPSGGKVSELHQLITSQGNSNNIDTLLWKGPKGFESMSPEKFHEVTGRKYTGENIIRDPSMLWKPVFDQNKQTINVHLAFANYCYEQFLRKQPKLFVKDKENWKSSERKFLGLYAAENIRKGTMLREYTGEIQPVPDIPLDLNSFETDTVNPYRLGDVDAENYGNGSELINEGFPVCQFSTVKDRGNIPSRGTVNLLADVEAGEEIYSDYGPSHSMIKFMVVYKMEGFNRQRMHEFFKKHTVHSILHESYSRSLFEEIPHGMMGSSQMDLSEFIDYKHRRVALAYLYSTPYAVYDLVLSGIIDVKELLKEMEGLYYRDFTDAMMPSSYHKKKGIKPFLQDLAKVMDFIKNFPAKDQKNIIQLFLEVSKEQKVFQWVELCHIIASIDLTIVEKEIIKLPTFTSFFEQIKDITSKLTPDDMRLSWLFFYSNNT
ncbi:MAG: SET domain-containing protein-lysine N-methyltransferase [Parachlamydiales bacterium]|jgi:hypothetical protein